MPAPAAPSSQPHDLAHTSPYRDVRRGSHPRPPRPLVVVVVVVELWGQVTAVLVLEVLVLVFVVLWMDVTEV